MHDEVITSNRNGPTGTQIEQLTSDTELIEKIRSIGFGTLTEFQARVIPLVSAGRDVVADGGKRGRTLAYLAPIAMLKEKAEKARTLIALDTEADAERIARNAHDLGLASAKVGGRQKGNRASLLSASVIVGTTQGFLDAFDEGTIEGSKIRRVIIDGTETAIQSGRTEEFLNLLHDLPSTQIVVLRKDSSMGIANFIKKFLKGPEEVTVQEGAESHETERSTVQSSPQEQPIAAAPAAAPRAQPASIAAPVVAAPAKVKKVPANAEHLSIELGNELAAKPSALADIIEGAGMPRTVVFCNSPSDADLTEVMLRKRGITARKLIGFAPPAKVTSSLEAMKSGEAAVLVVTDISARDIIVGDVALVVSYSIHTDPDVYMQRAAITEEGSTPVKVVSLVSPLDIPNFYNLKKLLGVTFNKMELPSQEQLLKNKLHALGASAKAQALSQNEHLKSIVGTILQDENKDDLLALLVHNTFDILPAALAEKHHASEPVEREESREGGYRDYDDRRGRGGRNDRRGGRRDDRGSDNGGYETQSDSNYSENTGSEPSSYERRERRDDDGRGQRRNDEPMEQRVPQARDIRLYIGHGTKEGLDQAAVAQLVTSRCNIGADQIKRTISRALYTFIDVPEAVADSVVSTLAETPLASGAKMFIKRAVIITSPREGHSSTSDDMATEGNNDQNNVGTAVTTPAPIEVAPVQPGEGQA